MGRVPGLHYDARRRRMRGPNRTDPAGECGEPRVRPIEQESYMSKKALFASMLLVFVAACAAKKEEVVYVEQPVSQEPVFTGKYK